LWIPLTDAILEEHEVERVNRFSLLDIEAPDSTEKSIRRYKEKTNKEKFSLKRWWKDGCIGLTLPQKIKNWYVAGNKKSKEKKKKKKDLDKEKMI